MNMEWNRMEWKEEKRDEKEGMGSGCPWSLYRMFMRLMRMVGIPSRPEKKAVRFGVHVKTNNTVEL